MSRTITIKGTGKAEIKPDLVKIGLYIESKDTDYAKAAALAAERVGSLKAAINTAGIPDDALKCSDLSVDTHYESVRGKDGSYRSEFAGYVCAYRMTLSHGLENGLLGKILSAVSDSGAKPEITVSFTVKDPDAAYEAVLTDAAKNARAKAEVLASASGVRLGELISVDYSDRRPDLISPTAFRAADEAIPLMASAKCAVPEIAPEDINVSDTVIFTWEIR